MKEEVESESVRDCNGVRTQSRSRNLFPFHIRCAGQCNNAVRGERGRATPASAMPPRSPLQIKCETGRFVKPDLSVVYVQQLAMGLSNWILPRPARGQTR